MKTRHSGPGKSDRKGISLKELFRMFPDDEAAREWFEQQVWPDGPQCPHCGTDNVQCGIRHRTMTHRCRECPNRPMFSLKTGTVMQSSNLGYQTWAIAIYLVTTSLKGVSSMKMHRDLEITQKSAWHLAHRLRKAFETTEDPFFGPVEIDETYIGGKRKNMSNAQRGALKDTGRGAVGKTAVAGVKDRASNHVRAHVVRFVDAKTLHEFADWNTDPDAIVYTDDASAYAGLPRAHETVKHSMSEYVRGDAHTNGVESFWSMLKRGYYGTFHHFSRKHTDRYVAEFSGRHNIREIDTCRQMGTIARQMLGKRLRYRELII